MTQFVRRRTVRRRERPAGGRVGRDLGSRACGKDAEDPENGQGDEVGQPGLEVAVVGHREAVRPRVQRQGQDRLAAGMPQRDSQHGVAVEKGNLVALHKSNEVPYSVGTLLVR